MTQVSTSGINGQAAAPMPSGLSVLTGAGAVLSAAHRDRSGNLHGHSWEVTAWWTGKPDAVAKQAELSSYLSFFDHSVLPQSVSLAEDLAVRVMEDLNCERVDISRPLERVYASVARLTPITKDKSHG